jgi:hypothetical protein
LTSLGFEPSPNSSKKTSVSKKAGTKSGTLDLDCPPDSDLQDIIDSWYELPDRVRGIIMAIVRGDAV